MKLLMSILRILLKVGRILLIGYGVVTLVLLGIVLAIAVLFSVFFPITIGIVVLAADTTLDPNKVYMALGAIVTFWISIVAIVHVVKELLSE